MKKAILTGATSQIGSFLIPLLSERGIEVHALSRKPRPSSSENIFWHVCDIGKGEMAANGETLFHLAPIWLLPDIVQPAASLGVRRILAFSSTSRFTKLDSGNPHERALAKKLEESEILVEERCVRLGISWTIFRPTLVYSPGMDRNLTPVSKFIDRFGFFPLAGDGRGLRQPVHASDLGIACMQALDNEKTYCKSYNLSGSETLPYREMIRRIFRGMEKKPKFVSIPLPVFSMLLSMLSLFPKYRHYTGEMAGRMNQDLRFDHEEAFADFGYSPGRFSWKDDMPEAKIRYNAFKE